MRDSILGIPSHDIDIALETPQSSVSAGLITGECFANKILEYQTAHGDAAASVSVIKANPEKSKHIETAQITIFNIPVEFCHLRHDEYSQVSRIPVVRPGTAREDALRRDFTVNALFYNLHTELVEDYTTGLEDLSAQLLRCPLDPKETFFDDPLRLLRCIRFAGQLGFTIDTTILESISQEMLTALETKVSRERFGVEWTKMLCGRRPDLCWRYILDMKLQTVVMQELHYVGGPKAKKQVVERVASMIPDDEEKRDAIFVYWSKLADLLKVLGAMTKTQEERLVYLMTAMVAPIFFDEKPITRRDRLQCWSTNGLKLPQFVGSAVSKMLDALDFMMTVDWKEARLSGLSAVQRELVFNALHCLSDKSIPQSAFSAVLCVCLAFSNDVSALSDLVKELLSKIDDGYLLASATCKLPLSGKELSDLLGLEPKQIGDFLHKERVFLLHNMHSSKEDIVEALRKCL